LFFVPRGGRGGMASVHEEEAVSGMWRSTDMSLFSVQFTRDTVKRDLLTLGRLGCCHFRHENDEEPHRDHMQGLRDAEEVEKCCKVFRDMLEDWKRYQPDGRWPLSQPSAPAVPDSYCWYKDTLDLDRLGTVSTDQQTLGMTTTIVQHRECLRQDRKKFGEFRDKFQASYFRHELLETDIMKGFATSLGTEQNLGGGKNLLVGAALPLSKASKFFQLFRRHSRGMATLEPECDTQGIPYAGFENLPKVQISADVAQIIAEKESDEGVISAISGQLLSGEQNAGDDWIFVVSLCFAERVFKKVVDLLNSQDAKLLIISDGVHRSGAGFPPPTSAEQMEQMRSEAKESMEDSLRMMLDLAGKVRESLTAVIPALEDWEQAACVHKAVSETMGRLKRTSGTTYPYHGKLWIPSDRVSEVQHRLGRPLLPIEQLSRTDKAGRPTYFPTNEFTATFQGIVDSYGTARYKEVNPAIWTIITFPYLFGVMYGDIGHGLIIAAAGFLFILYQDQLRSQENEIFQMIFGARYLLLLMGIFATYMGFLYNDCFSLMLEYSPSAYQYEAGWETSGPKYGVIDPVCPGPDQGPCATTMAPSEGPTPFGFDVAWMETTNKIDVYNSFKEKHAVIVGITQMMLGLFLQFANHIYFAKETGDYKRIFFGFIPEVVFLGCTFGYMCFIIIYKWTHAPPVGTHRAANLLETMTNFFLSPGGGPALAPGHELYEGQATVQIYLLLAAALMVVPFMLIPIPVLEWSRIQKIEAKNAEIRKNRESQEMAKKAAGEAHEETPFCPKDEEEEPVPDMQEIVIKQMIHCIEFVLGSVSNTASYLRLWALSLAHAQLSEVFWTFAFMLPFEKAGDSGSIITGSLITYLGFGVWITATIGVLVLMEALSAFLHALRLHWVEFQNKFYYADGVPFGPLDLSERIKERNAGPVPWKQDE